MQNWQHSVIYQIYPKSFHSHAGNATGDLLGIVDKLDYLKWLGVDCLWITPFLRSPQRDNGYDISDYYAIDPSYGTMADCDLLISEAAKRGITLMLDIVVNHTSIEHEWFQQARSSLDNPYRDFYIWRDQPNNWESKFGGSAWEYEAQTGQYFLHLFDHTQADLNWDNPKVRAEVFKLMRFWRDKGVGGFRLDVINLISKPADFPEDNSDGRRFYTDGPNVHHYLQEMHREVFEGHDLINVGEMSSTSLEHCIRYSNPASKELSMTFNFHHLKVDYPNLQKWVKADFDFLQLKQIFSDWQLGMQAGGGWNALFWCNHDQPRVVSRFGEDGEYRVVSAKMLATVVLIKMKRQRYIWVTMLPAVWLLICTVTAGFIKLFDANPAIGFLSLAKKYSDALAGGQILAPAKSIDQMQHVIWNAYTNATLTALFLFVVFSILFYALKVGIAAWGKKERTDKEAPYQAIPDA